MFVTDRTLDARLPGEDASADPGFAVYYDAIEPSLMNRLRDVIDAGARARGIDPDTATWT